MQGEHLHALDIWLRIEDPCVFEYIDHHPHLYEAAARGAPALMLVDEDRAVAVLVEHSDIVDANEVAAQLRDRALQAQGPAEGTRWRRRLYRYLHALFLKDRRARHNFHDLQARPLCLARWPSRCWHVCALRACQPPAAVQLSGSGITQGAL